MLYEMGCGNQQTRYNSVVRLRNYSNYGSFLC